MSSHTPGAPVSGKKVIIAFLAATFVLGVVTWYLPQATAIDHFKQRPAELDKTFAIVEKALLAYANDHGAFPPEEELYYYWKSRHNMEKSGAIHVPTYDLGFLTTPVAYLVQEQASDPFALPEQYSPLAYANLGDCAVIWSPGTNLRYELRAFEMRGKSRTALLQYLAEHTYDPASGTKKGTPGDVWRLIEKK